MEESDRDFSTRSRESNSVVTFFLYASSVLFLSVYNVFYYKAKYSRGESRLIDTVVDVVIDPLVHLFNILLQILG